MTRPESCAASSVERFFQFSLLGLVASGFLAVASSGCLDTPTVVCSSAALLLRAILLSRPLAWRPQRNTVHWLTLAYTGFFLVDYLTISRQPLPAVVHLVFFLAAVKVVTAASTRDSLATAALSFAALASGALLSLSFGFLAALALYLCFGVAALTSADIRRSLRQAAAAAHGGTRGLATQLAALAASMALGILALTAGLFFLSPHAAGGSALGSLLFHRIRLPGFSRAISLGEIAAIKSSSRTALHIRLYTAEPAGGLKWRGGALVSFDGRRWLNPGGPETRLYTDRGRLALVPVANRRPGRRVVYDVYLDAIDSDALFFTGTPEHVDVRAPYLLGSAASGFRLDGRPPQGFRYEAYGVLEDPPESSRPTYPPPVLDAIERSRCLQLPKLDSRIAELALRMSAGAPSDLEKARAVEQCLRTGYRYTLEIPSRQAADPLADFLFTRKKGHCEYFASAMAVLLRIQGIPARLATGFQSGIYNHLTNLWLIRSADAHAWVEAWIPGRGWTTFDPTPPAAPPLQLALATKLALYMDAADGLWQEWVVSYDPNHQGSLMDRLQQGTARLGIRWFDTLTDAHTYWDGQVGKWVRRAGPRILAAMVLAVALWFAIPPAVRLVRVRRRMRLVRRGQAGVADAALVYRRMLRILDRRGYRKPPWFTPAEFAASLPRTPLADAVGEFTAVYNFWRFGGRVDLAPRLWALLDELERAK
jgi:transglutaminase-like putative cysteine protease